MSEQLEKEFKALLGSVGKEIENKVNQAEKLMKEACELADRYGIPFSSNIIDTMNGWYIPETFQERFATLDKDVAMELTDISSYRLQNHGGGWTHSNIC